MECSSLQVAAGGLRVSAVGMQSVWPVANANFIGSFFVS